MDYSADFALSDEERRKLMLSNALLGLGAGLMQSGRGFSGVLGGAGTGLLAGVGLGQRAVADAREGKLDQAKMAEYMRKQQEAQAAAAAGAQLNTDLANVPPGAAQYEQAMKRAEMAANAGDVKRAEQYQKMAEFYRVKYGLTPQKGMRDGKPVMFVTSESGEQKEVPYGVVPDYQKVDTGGAVKFYDPLTGGAGGEFPKTVTPGEAQQQQQWQQDYRLRANADQRATNAARAAAEKGATVDPKVVSELRKEFNALDAVKAFNQVQPVLQSAREAVGVDNAAADLNLVYAAAKIMDPTSVVRESETTMVVNSGSPAQKYVGVFNHIVGGGRLTETVRKNLMREVESRGRGYESGYNVARKAYENIAAKNNIPADQVFIEPFVKSSPQQGSVQGRSVVRTGTNRKTGRKVVQYSDGTVEEQ